MERTIASTIRLLVFACCFGLMMQVFSQDIPTVAKKACAEPVEVHAFSLQEVQHKPGEMIVWLNGGVPVVEFLVKLKRRPYYSSRLNLYNNVQLKKSLSESLNIVLLKGFHPGFEKEHLAVIQNHPDVLFAQFNHLVQNRATLDSIPSDPNFGQQWNLQNTGQNGGTPDADIDGPEAWDFAQGGLTACGDSIVLALVDDGTDLTHEDLVFWINRNEIPGNNRDDDRDGYVDNYLGWDAFTQNGATQPSTFHGTATAGIMAARGNNNRGIAGVAWNSKIIPLSGASGDEATVVASYGYALDQRRRYDASNGREGAFVVAINSSFGVDNGDPADFPIWCAMYDTLGKAGIVSVSSVANSNIDIDQVDDMPTGCGSEYLITVTATTNRDERLNGAAWGRTTVDIGAPGRAVPGTAPGDNYSSLSGASAAAPQVTGAVALLMDRAGEPFLSLYDNHPDSAVKALKSMILASADPLPTLSDSAVSEGRLNLASAISEMDHYELTLPTCYAPFRIFATNVTDMTARLQWKGPEADSFLLSVSTPDTSYTERATDNFFTLEGLSPCTGVGVLVRAYCNGDSSDWSSVFSFETKGCCIAPELVYFAENQDDSLVLSWQPVFGIDSFLLRWRAGDTVWNELTVYDTLTKLGDLPPCSIFSYQLASFCDTGLSAFGEIVEESTGGCGSCTEKQFCEAFTVDPGGDWIERFTLGPLDMQSGNNNGYADFAMSATRLESGRRYALRLEPGFAGSAFDEHWRIWLDANQNGKFTDAGELIYDSSIATDTVITDSVTIPVTAWGGTARLRVRMRFASPPAECGGIGFGESEDYCVVINDFTGIREPFENEPYISIFPNPVSGFLHVECEKIPQRIALFDIHGKELLRDLPEQKKSKINLESLSKGTYLLYLEVDGQKLSRLVNIM